MCSSPAWAPAQIPAIPSCTVAGVFGIARTTGTSADRCFSIAFVFTAAATESTVCSLVTTSPISCTSAGRSWGLTAITITAAPLTASRLDSLVVTPQRSLIACRRSG